MAVISKEAKNTQLQRSFSKMAISLIHFQVIINIKSGSCGTLLKCDNFSGQIQNGIISLA